MLYGVDVHDGYQAGLNFATLVRQGYTFAAIKLTEGTSYARAAGPAWVRAARAAGLIPGAYHWLKRDNGAAQARWFHAKVREAGGPDGMLIQLDCEDDAGWRDVQAWHAEWMRLTGGHPYLVYSGAWWWDVPSRRWPGAQLTPYLWNSHYLTSDTDTVPDDPAAFAARIPAAWWKPGYGGWGDATFLQFTSRGDAGGLANNVDLNATRLTRDQLLTLTRPGGGTGPSTKEDDMPILVIVRETGAVCVSNYVQRRGLADGVELAALRARGLQEITVPEAQLPWYGVEVGAPAVPVLTDEQVHLLGADAAEWLSHTGIATKADVRDAVADGLEGGAAQVRAGD